MVEFRVAEDAEDGTILKLSIGLVCMEFEDLSRGAGGWTARNKSAQSVGGVNGSRRTYV